MREILSFNIVLIIVIITFLLLRSIFSDLFYIICAEVIFDRPTPAPAFVEHQGILNLWLILDPVYVLRDESILRNLRGKMFQWLIIDRRSLWKKWFLLPWVCIKVVTLLVSTSPWKSVLYWFMCSNVKVYYCKLNTMIALLESSRY